MDTLSDFVVEVLLEVIKKCKKGDSKAGKPWCLYTKDGKKLLGRHDSKKSAVDQEVAIAYHK